MNYADLQERIATDSKREDLINDIPDFIAEGEQLIFSRLESYALEITLDDDDRVTPEGGVYTLPARLVTVRSIIPVGCVPLDRVDETLIAQYEHLGRAAMYVPRPTSIVIAGTPAPESEFLLQYFGKPLPLSDVNNENTLLTDYPKLYKQAAQVSLYQRAKDYEAAQIAFQEANSTVDEINRAMKKLLGGRRSSNPYNVTFRSSY